MTRGLPGFLLILCVLCALPLGALAQSTPVPGEGPHNETPVPTGLQGVWSSPDCTDAREASIISPHYALFYRPGLYSLGAVQSWRQEDDDSDTLFQLRTNMNNTMLIKKTNDGLMKIRMIDVHPQAPLKSAWGSLEDRIAREYAHCAKLFDSGADFGQDEVNAVFLLDTAFKGCAGVTQSGFPSATHCHKALFDLVDSNKNKSLDRVELARIYRQVAFVLSASAVCGGIGYPDNSAAEAQDFAAGVLGNDKDITLKQMTERIVSPGFMTGRVLSFAENIRNTQRLLPFMPAPVTAKGCQMVEPENMKNLGTVSLPDATPSDNPTPKETGPAPSPAQALPE
ncbi:MAG: hypothetical protein JWO78_606 [Micavibrio sp.]|nr:hypothetical protein [Micavibrio sp.]